MDDDNRAPFRGGLADCGNPQYAASRARTRHGAATGSADRRSLSSARQPPGAVPEQSALGLIGLGLGANRVR